MDPEVSLQMETILHLRLYRRFGPSKLLFQAAALSKMAVLSALTLIRVFSLFHITLAFYILTSPRVIADQNIVFLLGESMHLVRKKVYS